MNTLNWRIRTPKTDEDEPEDDAFFFIEADLPNAKENGHYPRLELMQEDYGDHNGYTKEIRLADAELIVSAPKMKAAIEEVLKKIEAIHEQAEINKVWLKKILSESISNNNP